MQDIRSISIDLIKPNRYQPRLAFDDDKIIELSQSIKNNGLIQPIVVTESENGFEIVAGERRFRASILAGVTEVEAIVRKVNALELSEMALVENIQREDLTAIEEARAYVLLKEKFGLTQAELGKRVGKSQSTIANKLRLLNLSEDVQDAVITRQITERHARSLLKLDEEQQVKILDEIVEGKLTVSQTEKEVSKTIKPPVKKGVAKGFTKNHLLAINTVKQAVKMINDIGLEAILVEDDKEDEIVMSITIKK
ncbi:MAG: ParB/RepB/Spo0J family partition protein [Erysipelothrix sp.]|nr:ParB/RepB/Spo0J family partition protein [Erysipelothrix sp.]